MYILDCALSHNNPICFRYVTTDKSDNTGQICLSNGSTDRARDYQFRLYNLDRLNIAFRDFRRAEEVVSFDTLLTLRGSVLGNGWEWITCVPLDFYIFMAKSFYLTNNDNEAIEMIAFGARYSVNSFRYICSCGRVSFSYGDQNYVLQLRYGVSDFETEFQKYRRFSNECN